MLGTTIICGWQARIYPRADQAVRLDQWAGSLRFLWNRLLEAVHAEYAATGRFLWKKDLQPLAVGMKRQPGLEWLADLPAHAVLDTVTRIDAALSRMVEERKAGRRCGFPKFKKKFVRECGIYCVGQRSEIANRQALLPKLGHVRLRGGTAPEGRLLASRIVRDHGRWMLSAQFECPRPEPWEATGITVGLDLGVSTLVTAFDGTAFEETAAPKPLRRVLKRLRRAQRALARRRKGSARQRCQAGRVGELHRKVRDLRNDVLHQVSHRLTAKADVLKVETLNVSGMTRNRHLALSVSDAGLARLVAFIACKADWRGRRVERIDPWYPGSQTCCACGERRPEMRGLTRRVLACRCGNVMGRDRNAAVNHYWYGEEPRNRARKSATRVETGDQGLALLPVVETRTLAGKTPDDSGSGRRSS